MKQRLLQQKGNPSLCPQAVSARLFIRNPSGVMYPLFLWMVFVLFVCFSRVSAQETLAGLTSNGGPEGKGTAFTIQTNGSGYTILKSFADWGKQPRGTLTAAGDGNYYGMTSAGGAYNDGTIFRITPAGVITVLHHFNSVSDGANPYGNLIIGPDGHFYGMTNAGGKNTYGTIFRFTNTGVFTVLRHFSYAADGANPFGTLALGKDGHFYGVTRKGGSTGNGTIFRMTVTGAFTVLKTFSANPAIDGNFCYGSLTLASDSSFYGIHYGGGTFGNGTIFRITPKGVYTVLRHLKSATDGYAYTNNLVEGPGGFLYGSCYYGGPTGQGTVFKMSKTGVFTVLRSLTYKTDGSGPTGTLAVGTDGMLYGTCRGGGAFGGGTVYKISPAGVFTLLRSLQPVADGGTPWGGLMKGPDGQFYGTTIDGANSFGGSIFKISPAGVFKVLTQMNGGVSGNAPYESLVQGSDYGFYGTTSGGGSFNHGTVFKICGSSYRVLKSFNKGTEGGTPKGTLLLAKDGNFYGTTSEGGNSNAGTIFRITPAGGFSVIKHFVGNKDGGAPQGSLVQGADGFLYGTTIGGGANGGGTIFRISPAGVFSVIRHLAYATDGANPEGTLLRGPGDTVFFGTTNNGATIFKVTASGKFTVLKKLNSTSDGNNPVGSLIRGSDGNIYGLNSSGGTYGGGTVFSISEAGVFKVLKHFNAAADGSLPKGSLVQASDGHFYGMTSNGGKFKSGTIFRISMTGVYTVLRHFDLKTDGGIPFGSLVVEKKLNLVANPQSVITAEDVPKAIVLSGTGASPLTYTVVTAPRNGTVTAGTAAQRTYTPRANYAGKDSFYFVVNYGCVSSAPAKVLINITPVNNDAPVLDSIRSKTVKTGALLTFTAKATEYDQGQKKTFSLAGAPAGASIDPVTGIFRWTPAKEGVYTFTVKVADNGIPVLYDQELITVTVTAAFSGRLEVLADERSDHLVSQDIRVYSNPVESVCIIETREITGNLQIRILDVTGKVYGNQRARVTGNGKISVDMSGLTSGQYMIQLIGEKEIKTVKVIKQ